MALNPGADYPSQTTPGDPGYPLGKARNRSIPGDGTGFPWIDRVANDILGFQQSLLALAGIEPSGNPDKVGASDYLDSVRAIIARQCAHDYRTGSVATGSPSNLTAAATDRSTGRTMVVGAAGAAWLTFEGEVYTDVSESSDNQTGIASNGAGMWMSTSAHAGVAFAKTTTDDGTTWVNATPGVGTVASHPVHVTGSTWLVLVDTKIYRTTNDGLSWTLVHNPGTNAVASMACAAGRIIAVGSTVSSASYAVQSVDNGATWTSVAALPASSSGLSTIVTDGATWATTIQSGDVYYVADGSVGGAWTLATRKSGGFGVVGISDLHFDPIGGWLGTSQNGDIFSSMDGKLWVQRQFPTSLAILDATFGGGRWIMTLNASASVALGSVAY